MYIECEVVALMRNQICKMNIMPTQRDSIFICHTHILVSSVFVCMCTHTCMSVAIATSVQIFQGFKQSLLMLSRLLLTCSQQPLALWMG